MAKRILAVMLVCILAVGLLVPLTVSAAVTYPAKGTVTLSEGTLRMRASTSTSSAIVTSLANGAEVTVLAKVTGSTVSLSSGSYNEWYQVQSGSNTGYVLAVYIRVEESAPNPPSGSDTEFEAYLTKQGFPDSYKPALRTLHAAHSAWVFEAQTVNIPFETAVKAEYDVADDSLIEKTDPRGWKSYDKVSYNAAADSFNTFDGGSYHKASKDYLRYCMDPRNFLTEPNVYMFFVAKGQSGETAAGVSSIIKDLNWAKTYPTADEAVYFYEDGHYEIVVGTPPKEGTIHTESGNLNVRSAPQTGVDNVVTSIPSGTKVTVLGSATGTAVGGSTAWYQIKFGNITGYVHSSFVTVTEAATTAKEVVKINTYGDAFIVASRINGISAYMMASRVRQEQGVNGNSSGMGKVSGYEGYYNFWNINTSGDNKYLRGAQYAKEQGWDTPLKSIIGGSAFLKEKYFDAGQDTFYLQKYDVVDGGNGYYWHEYMTFLPAPWSEAKILSKAFTSDTVNKNYVFKIPVYASMPTSPCACPSETVNPNDYLKSVTVSGGTLSPNFDPYTVSYTATVPFSVTTAEITATPIDALSAATVSGTTALAVGNNAFTVTVTSSAGTTRTYSLTVKREEKNEPCTVTYDANGGTDAPEAALLEYGQPLSTALPHKDGHTFLGWAKSNTATAPDYAPGAAFTERDDVILYAVWRLNDLKIYYNANGGKSTAVGYASLADGTVIKTATDAAVYETWYYDKGCKGGLYNGATFGLVKENDEFVGWSTAQTGDPLFDQDDEALLSQTICPALRQGDQTVLLYAVWKSELEQLPPVLIGDVDRDGSVSAVDRVMLSRYLADWGGEYDAIDMNAADIDRDGEVSATDRVILARYLADWGEEYDRYFAK